MLATNVTALERLVRLLLGGTIAAYAWLALPRPSLVLIAIGACVCLSGIVGFCPACALFGRASRRRP